MFFTHGRRVKALLRAADQLSTCADGPLSTQVDSISRRDVSRQAAWATMEGNVMNREDVYKRQPLYRSMSVCLR